MKKEFKRNEERVFVNVMFMSVPVVYHLCGVNLFSPIGLLVTLAMTSVVFKTNNVADKHQKSFWLIIKEGIELWIKSKKEENDL